MQIPFANIHAIVKSAGAIFLLALAATLPVAVATPPNDATALDVHVFDVSGTAPAGVTRTVPANTYLGVTENFADSFSSFLGQINAIADPNSVVGIDSSAPEINRVVTDAIDLSRLNNQDRTMPYYLGTTSDITLAGPIIPTRTADGSGYDTLYLTALNDARLKVSTQLGTSASPVSSIVVGHPDWQTANTGVVELSAENAYTGGTRIISGALYVNGLNNLGWGPVTVQNHATLDSGINAVVYNTITIESGATLAGVGEYYSPISIGQGAILSPGDSRSVGTLHLHDGLSLAAGAIIDIDIGRTANDMLCVWNNLAIHGDSLVTITINLLSLESNGRAGALTNFDPAQSRTWTIAYRPGGAALAITGFHPSYFRINAEDFNFWNPNDGVFGIEQINNTLAITFTPVPEPGTYALMALGLGALALLRWRKRRRV